MGKGKPGKNLYQRQLCYACFFVVYVCVRRHKKELTTELSKIFMQSYSRVRNTAGYQERDFSHSRKSPLCSPTAKEWLLSTIFRRRYLRVPFLPEGNLGIPSIIVNARSFTSPKRFHFPVPKDQNHHGIGEKGKKKICLMDESWPGSP